METTKARGGRQPGAGRPKGSKNKNTITAALRAYSKENQDTIMAKLDEWIKHDDPKVSMQAITLLLNKTVISEEKEFDKEISENTKTDFNELLENYKNSLDK